eukprot:TRINITY_DN24064_c0_g1_i2.p1 TRINITY_DN24064_c0_g1~~TRINITY_DN24064_c0_g1_i2.p1  ORF type:complete len:341 (+),score=47.47 TRINITY_DN24064_c0_g1_i2:450-1472(+)
MWVNGILVSLESQKAIYYILGCARPLHDAVLAMREEFMQDRLECEKLLHWQLTFLHLLEPALCEMATPDIGVELFRPLCRPPSPWRASPQPAARLMDWIFIFAKSGADVVLADRGSPPIYGNSASMPVYTSLRLAAERRVVADTSRRPNRTSLLRALHDSENFMESVGGDRHLQALVNESCQEAVDFDEDTSQAFDPDLIKQLCDDVKPSVVIEVGVYRGRSTREFAKYVAEYVVAVDSFLGDAYMWTTKRVKYMPRLATFGGFPLVYYCFVLDVLATGLQHKIVPLPQTASQAFRVLDSVNVRAELIYIDAGHDILDVMQDLVHYWLLLACGGIMFGDD